MSESFYFLSKKYLGFVIDEVISIAGTYNKFTKAQNFANLLIIPIKKNLVIIYKKGFEKDISRKLATKYEICRHKNLIRMILVK